MYVKTALDNAETIMLLTFSVGFGFGFFIGMCITAICFVMFKKG